jgi:hypothetical protein
MFLTRLPVPASTDHHPNYLMRSTMVRGASRRRERNGARPWPALPRPLRLRRVCTRPPRRRGSQTNVSLRPANARQYFPAIGAVVGLWGAVFFWAAEQLWSRQIAAAVSTLATVWLTGAARREAEAEGVPGRALPCGCAGDSRAHMRHTSLPGQGASTKTVWRTA